jgi:hypothetical protein
MIMRVGALVGAIPATTDGGFDRAASVDSRKSVNTRVILSDWLGMEVSEFLHRFRIPDAIIVWFMNEFFPKRPQATVADALGAFRMCSLFTLASFVQSNGELLVLRLMGFPARVTSEDMRFAGYAMQMGGIDGRTFGRGLDMVYKASFIERAADIYRDYEQRRIDRSQLGIAVRSLAREYQ